MAEGTLAKMFWDRVERSGDGPAQQYKQGGAWHTLSWRQVGEAVREVATGLIALGRKRGDRKSTRLNSSHIQKSRMPSSA